MVQAFLNFNFSQGDFPDFFAKKIILLGKIIWLFWESLQANFVSKKSTFSIVKGRRTPLNKSGGTFRSSLLPTDDKSRR